MSSMAEPHKKTPQTSRFLGCFGFYGKKNPPEKPIKTGNSNKSRSPSCTMLCFPARKSRTKTVPVNNPDKKAAVAGDSHTLSKPIKKKPESKIPSRQNSKADQRQSASSKEGPDPNILLENRKILDPTKSGSSLPGSPTVKSKPNPKTHPKLSHTVSLSVLDGSKTSENPRIHDRVNLKHRKRKNNAVVGKFDPLIGLSIIMVTMVIMLLWGRLCAILCISVWFYFRSRTPINDNDTKNITDFEDLNFDLNSEEYKKKIVLEGLLERNHKVTLRNFCTK